MAMLSNAQVTAQVVPSVAEYSELGTIGFTNGEPGTSGLTTVIGPPPLLVEATDSTTGLPTTVDGYKLQLSKRASSGYKNVKRNERELRDGPLLPS